MNIAYASRERTLGQRWQALLAENPGLRIRNAATRLGVSELELLLTREQGVDALTPDFGALLSELDPVGDVMILTRNDQVVHEVTGAFRKFTVTGRGTMGLAVGDIDVRAFLNNWAYGYLVREDSGDHSRRSLQFFDCYGRAIHKIYMTDATDRAAWDDLLSRYLDPRTEAPELEAAPEPEPRTSPDSVDVAALRKDWSGLKDVHHFHAMLKRNQVDRMTALELVGDAWVRPLESEPEGENCALDHLLMQVRDSQCPVMVFVGNRGMVQIFTGTVTRLLRTGPWMNVLDKGFSLHADTHHITRWFVVRRPSADGVVTSVEGYNRDGELVITVFGQRKPGQPESHHWQQEVARLEAEL